jgi:hypothetical protein
MYRACLTRIARHDELPVLLELISDSRNRFQAASDEATQLNRAGAVPLDANLDGIDVAVWTVVASAILNLDETITRR